MTGSPHFSYAHRRRASRYRPDPSAESVVEFELANGSHWRLGLVEISACGVGFSLDKEQPALFVGANIGAATIRAGNEQISGSLRIAHVTPEFASGTICGAEFIPNTKTDELALNLLLVRLEQQGQRSG